MTTINEQERLINTILRLYQGDIYRPEVCKKCGGECCKRCGCACHPRNFHYRIEEMKKALLSGKYSIEVSWQDPRDCFSEISPKGITLSLSKLLATPTCYLFIRARNRNRPIVDILHLGPKASKFVHEGPCVMWDPQKGCTLSIEERPLYGVLSSPVGKPDLCSYILGEDLRAASWRMGTFQKDLFGLAKELVDQGWLMRNEMPQLHFVD